MSSVAATHPLGRDATKPTEIPARGWKEIALRVFSEFKNDRVQLVAAGVTFYLLLSLVPALTALVSMYGLFTEPANVQEHLSLLQKWLPGGGQEIFAEQLQRLSSQANTSLGFALAGSLAIALWSTNNGMKALFEAMNVAYDEAEERSFIKLTLTSLVFTLGAMLLLITIVAVVVILPAVLPLILNALGLGSQVQLLVQAASGLILVAAALVALSALYRWGPSRSEAQWKWITPGAGIAALVGIIASVLFSWYVSNFGTYNETYGSLGAVIGFMTWLWIMVTFIITGGELNAEMEHQTQRDSTTGPAQPMGQRGAQMADTVAQGAEDTANRNATEVGNAKQEDPSAAGDGSRNEEWRGSSRPPRARSPGALLILGGLALAIKVREERRARGTAGGRADLKQQRRRV